MLAGSSKRSAWWAGTATLGLAKIIENMEIGHNVMHGQWNWMNDPEIHSTKWEWDMSAASKHWRAAHNFQHHKYTNILDMDDDVGYFILRVTRDQPWHPYNIGNLLFNALLSLGFEWGIGLQTVDVEKASLKPARIATSPGSRSASSLPRPAGRYSRTTLRSRHSPRCRRRPPTRRHLRPTRWPT